MHPWSTLLEHIRAQGGFVNAHSHLDRAHTVTADDFNGVVERSLHEKWKLVDAIKQASTEEDYYQRITYALEEQIAFGVQAILSFIDCDPVAKDRALKAALRAKDDYQNRITLKIACQTLKGVLAPEARYYFDMSLDYVDIIGGLPGADKGREAEHLDVLFAAAKRTGKRVHVHVDQLNTRAETETELLARKTLEWGLEGQVTAVHAISLAAHPKEYRESVYALCQQAQLSFVACPTAWIDARRSEELAPLHNAITPIDELIPHGITVALGSDNIEDIYKPFSTGDMATELKVLLEATHFYNIPELCKITTQNGLVVLGEKKNHLRK